LPPVDGNSVPIALIQHMSCERLDVPTSSSAPAASISASVGSESMGETTASANPDVRTACTHASPTTDARSAPRGLSPSNTAPASATTRVVSAVMSPAAVSESDSVRK
jgi:hypothetical protein